MRSTSTQLHRLAVRLLVFAFLAATALQVYPHAHAETAAVTLSGAIQISPEHALRNAHEPLDLVVVLDASVSQNWTADGYGTLSYESAPALEPYQPADRRGPGYPIRCADPRIRDSANPCQERDAWRDYTQRRLYRVKHALGQFLDQLPWRPDDRAALVTFNGGWSSAAGHSPADLTAVFPASGLTSTITSTYAYGLVGQLFDQAATSNPGSRDQQLLYRTSGGAPGALGLQRAQAVLNAGGSGGARTRAVLMLVDGMLNVSLDGTRSADERLETNAGDERKPLSQALAEGEALKTMTDGGSLVFTVGLTPDAANVPLSELASGSHAPFFQTDESLDGLDQRFAAVSSVLGGPACTPVVGPWQVPALERIVDDAGHPQDTLGTVRAFDSQGTPVATAAIQADGSWALGGLVAGQSYSLTAMVEKYVGDDGVGRSYSRIALADGETRESMSVVIDDAPSGRTQALADPVRLRVGEDVCAPTSEATPTPAPASPTVATATASPTPSPTASPTMTSTRTRTPKPSATATRTATLTRTATASATATTTRTPTTPPPSATSAPTATATRTATPTRILPISLPLLP